MKKQSIIHIYLIPSDDIKILTSVMSIYKKEIYNIAIITSIILSIGIL